MNRVNRIVTGCSRGCYKVIQGLTGCTRGVTGCTGGVTECDGCEWGGEEGGKILADGMAGRNRRKYKRSSWTSKYTLFCVRPVLPLMCEKMLVIGFGSTITQHPKVDYMYDVTKKIEKTIFPSKFCVHYWLNA